MNASIEWGTKYTAGRRDTFGKPLDEVGVQFAPTGEINGITVYRYW